MGRKSTFQQLPQDIEDKFIDLLSDQRYTQEQIAGMLNQFLEEKGLEPVITKRVVQNQAPNYKERLAKIGENMRREKLLVNEMMETAGREPDMAQSQFLSVMLQSMSANLAMEMMEREEAISPKELKELAQAKKIIDESNKITEQLVRQARQEAAEQAKQEAAANVEQAAKQAGLSAEQVQFWREQVLMGA